jgi:hypothetical protein
VFFGTENESVHHLFFGCVVAQRAWRVISQIMGVETGSNFESVDKMWLCNKKFGVINIVTSAVCWSLWKLRNSMIFQEVFWVGRCHYSTGKDDGNAREDQGMTLMM